MARGDLSRRRRFTDTLHCPGTYSVVLISLISLLCTFLVVRNMLSVLSPEIL